MNLHAATYRILIASTLLVYTGGVSALEIFVPQNATYRYINATAATTTTVPADWFAFGFDDSGWFVDQGPFSSNGKSTFGTDQANVNAPFEPGSAPPLPSNGADYIQWEVNRDPFVRTEFFLAAPTALTIWIAVDNGIGPFPKVAGATGMYLNGVEGTASVNAEGQAFRWEHVFDVAADYTFAGRNVLAFNLEDHGVATAFAMVVTADDPVDHEDFSSNPPPQPPSSVVPEPGTFALLLIGVVALARTALRQ